MVGNNGGDPQSFYVSPSLWGTAIDKYTILINSIILMMGEVILEVMATIEPKVGRLVMIVAYACRIRDHKQMSPFIN